MTYKFTSNYKDEYGKLIEGLEKEREELAERNSSKIIKVETNIPNTTFFTTINNYNCNFINGVRPRIIKDNFKYTVIKK